MTDFLPRNTAGIRAVGRSVAGALADGRMPADTPAAPGSVLTDLLGSAALALAVDNPALPPAPADAQPFLACVAGPSSRVVLFVFGSLPDSARMAMTLRAMVGETGPVRLDTNNPGDASVIANVIPWAPSDGK